MPVGFLLHFYQPSNQFESVFRQVCNECYIPLLRYLKNEKRLKVSANLPLPFLVQLEKYGYEELISLLKDLVASERLEVVGTGAFHPLFTKIPRFFAEYQVILNEISLSCYFGSLKDFEGEPCFLVKDLRGFFPPELAVNLDFVKLLSEFGYDWVLVEDKAVFYKSLNTNYNVKRSIYSLKDAGIKLVVRDGEVSNWIAFKRDLNVNDLIKHICQKDVVIAALDAETFGHHYKEGVLLFELIISNLLEANQEILTISDIVKGEDCYKLEYISESTWGSLGDSIYPLWENKSNPVNAKLWALYDSFHRYITLEENSSIREKLANEALIESGSFESFKSFVLNDDVSSVFKLQQSDQFWWSTGFKMGKKPNFSVYMVESVLYYYKQAFKFLGLEGFFGDKINELFYDLRSYNENQQKGMLV